MLRIGIVGLPNVGKSTLFQALTRIAVPIAPYPFTTIEPHVGVVARPDERLRQLRKVLKPERTVSAVIPRLEPTSLFRRLLPPRGSGSSKGMKAIILAGGAGTRLRPVTLEIPKPLLTVKKKPILNVLLELLGRHGAGEVKVIIRPDDQADFSWWQRRYGPDIAGVAVSLETEPEPMGTFGYLWSHLRDWIGEEDVFLTNGDELKDVDLTAMLALHRQTQAVATIALVAVENPKDYGVAELNGPHIVNFVEKSSNPPSNWINSGTYVLSPRIFSALSVADLQRRKLLMIEKDVFPRLAAQRLLAGYQAANCRWYDCGTLERWERAIREW